MPTNMKMYILILDDVPTGYAINSAAHASLACYLKFQHLPIMSEWLDSSFKKVTCKVSREQLEKALDVEKSYHVSLTESSLGNRLMCVAWSPRTEWDPFFKTLTLWK